MGLARTPALSACGAAPLAISISFAPMEKGHQPGRKAVAAAQAWSSPASPLPWGGISKGQNGSQAF